MSGVLDFRFVDFARGQVIAGALGEANGGCLIGVATCPDRCGAPIAIGVSMPKASVVLALTEAQAIELSAAIDAAVMRRAMEVDRG